MKKSLAVSVISILAIAVIGLGIMYFSSNASQKQQIDTLNADIANKASQIDTLNADIARKDGQIEALNADVSEKTGRIETLTADAADQAGRIEEMNATISEQGKKISELSATVDEQKKKLDYGQMPEEELLAAAGEITAPLEKMGYTVLVRNYNRLDRNNGAGDSVENAFLNDLAKGLEDRWTITDKQQDQSTMTDQQSIDYFSSLVMCELDYIGKYTDLEFSDKNLEAYAHEYISALQKQYTGITEYYGTDDAQYKQYWKNGYDSRTHMLYWISRKYGIPVDSKYKEHLSEMVEKAPALNSANPLSTP